MMDKEYSEAIRELLCQTRCTDLLKGQAVIEIDADDSIAKGCQVDIEHSD